MAIVYIDGDEGQRCNPETSLHILYTFWNGISGYAVSNTPLTLAQATPLQRFRFRLKFADINLSVFA